MYLMALNNIDYIVITVFFAVLFLISYLFRRQQNDSHRFLFGDTDTKFSQINHYILGFGVIELVLLGVVGALKGFSGVYYILVSIIISYIILYFINKTIYPKSVYEYISEKIGPKISAVYAILSAILLFLWVSITVVLTSKLFLSLLGWSFVNSIFGVTLLTLICIEVGGSIGAKYNNKVWISLVAISFLFLFTIAAYKLSPLGVSLANLSQLAVNQGKPQDFYTSIHFFRYTHLSDIVFASIAILVIFPIITSMKLRQKSGSILLNITKLVMVVVMVVCGVFAVMTPVKNLSSSGNSKIVTYQAQLPDGQVGYVIKTIDAKNTSSNPIPGIIPPLLNAKTNLIEQNKYDYKLANLVMFRHYLPSSLMVLLIITIMSAFMYTVSQFLLSIAKIITLDICPPLGLLKSYGEEGMLWCARMSVVFIGGASLFAGYFLSNFELVTLMYTVIGYSLVLVILLLIIVAKYGRQK